MIRFIQLTNSISTQQLLTILPRRSLHINGLSTWVWREPIIERLHLSRFLSKHRRLIRIWICDEFVAHPPLKFSFSCLVNSDCLQEERKHRETYRTSLTKKQVHSSAWPEKSVALPLAGEDTQIDSFTEKTLYIYRDVEKERSRESECHATELRKNDSVDCWSAWQNDRKKNIGRRIGNTNIYYSTRIFLFDLPPLNRHLQAHCQLVVENDNGNTSCMLFSLSADYLFYTDKMQKHFYMFCSRASRLRNESKDRERGERHLLTKMVRSVREIRAGKRESRREKESKISDCRACASGSKRNAIRSVQSVNPVCTLLTSCLVWLICFCFPVEKKMCQICVRLQKNAYHHKLNRPRLAPEKWRRERIEFSFALHRKKTMPFRTQFNNTIICLCCLVFNRWERQARFFLHVSNVNRCPMTYLFAIIRGRRYPLQQICCGWKERTLE